MRILVDTREQLPYGFTGYPVTPVSATLPTGDYALPGDEYRFSVERKSPSDFLKSIGSDWPRVSAELDRAQSLVFVVEAPLDLFMVHLESGRIVPPEHSAQFAPQFVQKRVADMLGRHGVSVFFCANREYAEAMTWQVLRGRWLKIRDVVV